MRRAGFVAGSRLWLFAGLVVVASGGCSKGSAILQPQPIAVQPPVSPSEAVVQIQRAWETLDADEYEVMLAGNFRFVFASNDTAGRSWLTTPWSVVEERNFFEHLTRGGDGIDPVAKVAMAVDRTPIVQVDSRPGHADFRIHKVIRTALVLNLTDSDGLQANCSGQAVFFMVRGDSAVISEQSRAALDRPDSTFWFLERWEDETTPRLETILAPQPTRSWTVGQIKTLFRRP